MIVIYLSPFHAWFKSFKSLGHYVRQYVGALITGELIIFLFDSIWIKTGLYYIK